MRPVGDDASGVMFQWQPLGGLGEVGMNSMLLRMGEASFLVDCGILFADQNNFGIEAVIPDFSELIAHDGISSILITHGHEDHIGALPLLMSLYRKMGKTPPLIWAPPFARALIEAKFDDERYPKLRHDKIYLKEAEIGEFQVIDGVDVKFAEVRHSTLDACSLAFRAKFASSELRLFHSADFKVDFNEFEDGSMSIDAFDCFDGQRPHIAMIDSTNANREGQSVSERDIIEPIEALIKGEQQRVFVTLFSSNVYRIAAIVQIAEKLGRKVAIAGRSMQNAFRLAMQSKSLSKLPVFSDSTLVSPENISDFAPEKQLILCSGSQGEVRSVLSKVAQDSHPEFSLQEGDLVLFSSKVIPGNERSVHRLINSLLRMGAKVFWGDDAKKQAGGPVHASGHARASELRAVINKLQPDHVIPVHGQRFQLEACGRIAQECSKNWGHVPKIHLCENLDLLSFVPEGADSWKLAGKKIGDPFAPKFLRLERFMSPSRDLFLRDRKRAALGGVVAVHIDGFSSMKVELRGVCPDFLADEDPYASLKEEIEAFLRSTVKSKKTVDWASARFIEDLEAELERFVRRVTGARPLAIVTRSN